MHDPKLFYNNFLTKNTPFLVNSAAKDWPALKSWKSTEYLRSAFQEFEDDFIDNMVGIAIY